MQVTDGAGHAVAGAAVRVYQTATALVDCPSLGRCPAAPVLASLVTVMSTDADGAVSVQPLVVPGVATRTELLFSAGTSGAASAYACRRVRRG